MNNRTEEYCNLRAFQDSYREIHGYASVTVCVFGSIANILNIIVLTSKEMRMPTNYILTALAVADLLVMLEYIPFSSHNYFDPNARHTVRYFSYPWAVYMYFHALFAQVLHFIACCLTVILAIWRYIAITYPQNNKIWCSMDRTKLAIIFCYMFCPFVCTPLYLGLQIHEKTVLAFRNGTFVRNVTNTQNATIYVIGLKDEYITINLWLYGVVIKLLPCVCLTILSVFLIRALIETKKRWQNLTKNAGVPLVNGDARKQKNIEKEQQADRVTRMLLAVLLLFLITEFPQAVLGMLGLMLGNEFQTNCYNSLGDLMDIIALTNSAINFILYCSISQQFRCEFKKIFIPHSVLAKWTPDTKEVTKTTCV